MGELLGYRVQKSVGTGGYKNTNVLFKSEEKAKAYCSDQNTFGWGTMSHRYVEEYLEYADESFDLDPKHRQVYNQFSSTVTTLDEYHEYLSNVFNN